MKIAFLTVALLSLSACAVSDLNGEKSAPPVPSSTDGNSPIPLPILMGADKPAEKNLAIAGKVYKGENLSRAPIAGAKVKVLLGEKVIGETITLPSGLYNWSGPIALGKKLKVRVEYKNSVGEISFEANKLAIDNLDVNL